MKLKIISDGTNIGTKLVDEDSGEFVSGIKKINLSLESGKEIQDLSIEFFNIPVEIEVKAEVQLLSFIKDNNFSEPFVVSTFEKDIIIKTFLDKYKAIAISGSKIIDKETGKSVGAVQSITWEAKPDGIVAKVKKLKINNIDWV